MEFKGATPGEYQSCAVCSGIDHDASLGPSRKEHERGATRGKLARLARLSNLQQSKHYLRVVTGLLLRPLLPSGVRNSQCRREAREELRAVEQLRWRIHHSAPGQRHTAVAARSCWIVLTLP